MSVLHILTEILNTPLMVTPAKLQTIMSVLDQRSDRPFNLDLSALAHMSSGHGGEMQAASRPVNAAEPSQIAVVSALGSFVARNHGSDLDDGSGLRSYRVMQRDIQMAVRAPEVGGILLDIDTFGGASAGCERFIRFIHEADQIKPIYGVVDLSAYSAGYSIAAACRKIILTDRTAGVSAPLAVSPSTVIIPSGWKKKVLTTR